MKLGGVSLSMLVGGVATFFSPYVFRRISRAFLVFFSVFNFEVGYSRFQVYGGVGMVLAALMCRFVFRRRRWRQYFHSPGHSTRLYHPVRMVEGRRRADAAVVAAHQHGDRKYAGIKMRRGGGR